MQLRITFLYSAATQYSIEHLNRWRRKCYIGLFPLTKLITLALIFSLLLFSTEFISTGLISTGLVSSAQAQAISTAQQAALAQQSQPQELAEVSQFLQKQLAETNGSISFLIMLKEQPDVEQILARTQLNGQIGAASRVARATAIYNTLTSDALKNQRSLYTMLEANNIPYTPFYIVNMIEVTGDSQLVSKLRRRSDVDRLIANPWVRGHLAVDAVDRDDTGSEVEASSSARYVHKSWSWLTEFEIPENEEEFAQQNMTLSAASLLQPYGLAYTGAPNVWAQGIRGQGIVLASQDTGVEWTHPSLKEQYRGWNASTGTVDHIGNWFDAWGTEGRPSTGCTNDAQMPCDDNGHGTHTVGTMLGDASATGGPVIGMAPDAEWIGCRNMDRGTGTIGSYTACFEFFLAPYPQNGNKFRDGQPALAPHIINNSWGCPPMEGCDPDSLRQVVETVRSAGIMVVASAGNEGRSTVDSCATVMNPIAIHDASFSIGAHDSSGDITVFSSRGPVTVDGSGRAKPDIVAPGLDVESAWPTYMPNSSHYATKDGTSMSSPHVAGASALVWSAAPELIGEIDLTEQVLIKSATPVDANLCGEGTAPVSPNYTFGYGLLDVEAAVAMSQSPAKADVTLLNCDGSALPNALVQLTDDYTGYQYSVRTNTSGIATIPTVYADNAGDSFTLTADAGIASFPASTLTIAAGAAVTSTLQAAATCAQPMPLAMHVQTGDDATRIPLAIVRLTSKETGLVYTTQTDGNGNATLSSLYQGDYDLTINAVGHEFEETIITLPPIGSSTMPPITVESIVDTSLLIYMPILTSN